MRTQNDKPVVVYIQGVNYDVSKHNQFSPTETDTARFFRAAKLREYARIFMSRQNGRN